jgi:hypothetical protein
MLRLLDQCAGDATVEDRAAALIRGALVPREPDQQELARIEQALRSPAPRRARTRVIFRLALAALFLLAGGATVKAYELVRRAGWLGPSEPSTQPPPEPARSRTAKRRAQPAPPAPAIAQALPVATEDPPSPTSEASQVRAAESTAPSVLLDRETPRRPPRSVARTALRTGKPSEGFPSSEPPAPPIPPVVNPPGSKAPAPQPATSDEVLGLDRAIGYLRRDHNAPAALAALDAYLARYPHGLLQREAHLARIDALLMLRHTALALDALEAMTFDQGRRSTELLIVRAELRAEQDCRRAEQDFTAALGRSPDATLLERILYGRGACRAKLRDTAGATADVQRYLERFPSGAHAEWARRFMANQESSAERGR